MLFKNESLLRMTRTVAKRCLHSKPPISTPKKVFRYTLAIGGVAGTSWFFYNAFQNNSTLKVMQYLFSDKQSLFQDKDYRTCVSISLLDIATKPRGDRLLAKSSWGITLTRWILNPKYCKPEMIYVLSYLCSINSEIFSDALLEGGFKIFNILQQEDMDLFEKSVFLLIQTPPNPIFTDINALKELYNNSSSSIIQTFVLWCFEGLPPFCLEAKDIPLPSSNIPYYQKLHLSLLFQNILPPENVYLRESAYSNHHEHTLKDLFQRIHMKTLIFFLRFDWIKDIYDKLIVDQYYYTIPLKFSQVDIINAYLPKYKQYRYRLKYIQNKSDDVDSELMNIQEEYNNEENDSVSKNTNLVVTNKNEKNSSDLSSMSLLETNDSRDYRFTKDTVYIKEWIELFSKWMKDEDERLATNSVKSICNLCHHPASLAYYISVGIDDLLSISENINMHLSVEYRREIIKLIYLINYFVFDEDKQEERVNFAGQAEEIPIEYQEGSRESYRWRQIILYTCYQTDLFQSTVAIEVIKNFIKYSNTPYQLINDYLESTYKILSSLAPPSLATVSTCYYNKISRIPTDIWKLHCLLRSLCCYLKGDDMKDFLISHQFLLLLECLKDSSNPAIQGELARSLCDISMGNDRRSRRLCKYILLRWNESMNNWLKSPRLKVRYMTERLLYNIKNQSCIENDINNDNNIYSDDFSNCCESNNIYNKEELDDGIYIMNYNELVNKQGKLIEPDYDIVFIHGVGGSFYKTWVTEGDKTYQTDVWISQWLTPYIKEHLKNRDYLEDNEEIDSSQDMYINDNNELSDENTISDESTLSETQLVSAANKMILPKDKNHIHSNSSYSQEDDKDITIRILSIKYPAKISRNKSHQNLEVAEIGAIVERQLEMAGVGKRPVIFVVHSMGGIILKHILVKQYEKSYISPLLYSTKGICFYSTPHKGTPVMKQRYNLIEAITPFNKAVNQLYNSSPELLELNNRFLNMPYIPRLLCICEGKPVVVNKHLSSIVVPEYSSRITDDCDYFIDKTANHIEICKPKDMEDPRFVILADFIVDIMSSGDIFEEDIDQMISNSIQHIKEQPNIIQEDLII
ncbi:hypothetical protein WA158_000807 [Blastocystis sp. Blastoise]